MVAVTNLESLKYLLKRSFLKESKKKLTSRIVALLLAQPDNFTQEELYSQIDYFNIRSGDIMDYYCVGYIPSNIKVKVEVNGVSWTFKERYFNQFRKDLEKITNWNYSGSAEIILFDAKFFNNEVEFCFKDAICIDLKKAIKNESMDSFGSLFEKIVKFSEKSESSLSAKKLSTALIKNAGKNSFVSILIKLLPESIRIVSSQIYLYGTSNLEK